jgi:hypothetical protein
VIKYLIIIIPEGTGTPSLFVGIQEETAAANDGEQCARDFAEQ